MLSVVRHISAPSAALPALSCLSSRLASPCAARTQRFVRHFGLWSKELEKGHVYKDANEIINHDLIFKHLEATKGAAKDKNVIKDILERAKERSFLKDGPATGGSEYVRGLELDECATLLNVNPDDTDIMEEIYNTAFDIKNRIYGNRIVLFAPLYLANYCVNGCAYCAFRSSNKAIQRTKLSDQQVTEQVSILERQGHRRILALTGEHPAYTFEDFLHALKLITEVRTEPCGSIRRINVEIPSLSVSDMKRLKAADCVGTYTLFQETYHKPTFHTMHPWGPKSHYENRVLTHDRAMRGGLDDVGIGVLFGLYDYRFECMAMLMHSNHLEEEYRAGPHTISVPRMRPAMGSGVASDPPYPVDDAHFKKLVAILRIAVPYTGMILSTREAPEMRAHLLRVGMSQMSAGSSTEVGGYHRHATQRTDESLGDLTMQALLPEKYGKAAAGDTAMDHEHTDPNLGGQFQLEDTRSSEEIVHDLLESGYVPSWCTACYRKGRTGEHFMKIAKAGNIHNFCHPNSLLTLQEWLNDYASPEIKELGNKVIAREKEIDLSDSAKRLLDRKMEAVNKGQHDVYI
ncbi:unnamed protein product [Vitrella brassicaformis CCMP3155]|uniref:Biotin and thiamin synthesis-associated domain-containing protein n=2 Tax=Vitrella brassicaformis TaxID=1169539 RepID=A0A0G4G6G3_VITBC|nr:unnamed protein product [Vitrella brassicaformis CCMP3155]|mmetsp:Transcript_13569/g.32295  ORF Transcript_13569/g.32295 Transcript_13569/m.32295 type:complete len:574 (+) Transcript_13569:97-1818(+)|eukprot:CEM24055.1 unnamed protein product [Vitrella brassicaformis CCMP3155]